MRPADLWAWESHAPRQRRDSQPAPRPSIKRPRVYAAPFHLNSRETGHPSEGPRLPQEKAWQTKNLGPHSSLFPIINIHAFSFTNQLLIKRTKSRRQGSYVWVHVHVSVQEGAEAVVGAAA